MLSARLRVQVPDDWTERIGRLDVQGDIFTATLVDTYYKGLIRIYGTDVSEGIDIIESEPAHTEVNVIEHSDDGRQEYALIFVAAEFDSMTPFRTVVENEYLMIEPTFFEDGWFHMDLLLHDRDRLVSLIDELDEICSVKVEHIISDVMFSSAPNPASWTNMIRSLTDRQIEILALATEKGYFDYPREATIEDIADDLGLHKTTVSEHLRRSTNTIVDFILDNYFPKSFSDTAK